MLLLDVYGRQKPDATHEQSHAPDSHRFFLDFHTHLSPWVVQIAQILRQRNTVSRKGTLIRGLAGELPGRPSVQLP